VIDRRDLILGGIFLAGLGVEGSLSLSRRGVVARPTSLDALLPQHFDVWQAMPDAAPLLPQRDAYVDQIYDDYVARCYARSGFEPVVLLIAYGKEQGGGMEVHRPESCYPPYGFTLSPSRSVHLDLRGRGVAATVLTATIESSSQQILYWVRVGEQFPATHWQASMAVAGAALTGRVLDGVLVRMSTANGDAAAGQHALAEFASRLLDSAPSPLADLLVGRR
jgi:EpsI family protein